MKRNLRGGSRNSKVLNKIINYQGILLTISWRSVRHINLYVKPPYGEVLVTAPRHMAESRILSFVEEKQDWIRFHQEQIRSRTAKEEWRAGEENDGMGAGSLSENRLVTPEQLAWLKERISYYAAKWEPVMGVHCVRFTIRDMKSRWGSCTIQKRTIRINLQLAKKPEECVEYVVVHELTHLLEASHNKVFHAYMKQFLPDYKEREKLLNGRLPV